MSVKKEDGTVGELEQKLAELDKVLEEKGVSEETISLIKSAFVLESTSSENTSGLIEKIQAKIDEHRKES